MHPTNCGESPKCNIYSMINMNADAIEDIKGITNSIARHVFLEAHSESPDVKCGMAIPRTSAPTIKELVDHQNDELRIVLNALQEILSEVCNN